MRSYENCRENESAEIGAPAMVLFSNQRQRRQDHSDGCEPDYSSEAQKREHRPQILHACHLDFSKNGEISAEAAFRYLAISRNSSSSNQCDRTQREDQTNSEGVCQRTPLLSRRQPE